MSATAKPPATDPDQLTIRFTKNPDGWVTAQIVEFPAAISQGATDHEAWLNVLEALHDLMHEPTPTERIAAVMQEIVDSAEAFVESLNERVGDLVAGARRASRRDRVH